MAAKPAENLAIEWWPLEKITPYERNARVISEKAVEKVASSLTEFGWQQPIVVDEGGVIIAGHTRLLAAASLEHETVPVLVAADLAPEQVKAYRLADNRTHEEALWNDLLLGTELTELGDFGLDLTLTGFDEQELTQLLSGGWNSDIAAVEKHKDGLATIEDCVVVVLDKRHHESLIDLIEGYAAKQNIEIEIK